MTQSGNNLFDTCTRLGIDSDFCAFRLQRNDICARPLTVPVDILAV